VSLPWKFAAGAFFCLASVATFAQQPDQLPASRLLGPQWKKMVRTAGMIFSGTVLSVGISPSNDQVLPTMELKFRVDRAIAGVDAGEVLTIREWTGAWSLHRPMHTGEHMLLLLYPPSSLGFTSPVGGSLGQITLDASGTRIAAAAATQNISVQQLERAIRSARLE
jgi:hypothetical protein